MTTNTATATYDEFREAFIRVAAQGLYRSDGERDLALLRGAPAGAMWLAVGTVDAACRPEAKSKTFPQTNFCAACEVLAPPGLITDEAEFWLALGWMLSLRAQFTASPTGPLPDDLVARLAPAFDEGLCGQVQACWQDAGSTTTTDNPRTMR